MKTLLCTLLACSCLFLMGCPLQTDAPIKGETSVNIPSWLPGRWTKVNDGKLTATMYLVAADPAAREKLQITKIDGDGKPDDDGMRPAVLSKVKGKLFLSVYEKGDEASDAGYYHFALDRVSGELELVPLKELIVSSEASGAELAAYIAAHMKADDYLDKPETERYRKQK